METYINNTILEVVTLRGWMRGIGVGVGVRIGVNLFTLWRRNSA